MDHVSTNQLDSDEEGAPAVPCTVPVVEDKEQERQLRPTGIIVV